MKTVATSDPDGCICNGGKEHCVCWWGGWGCCACLVDSPSTLPLNVVKKP